MQHALDHCCVICMQALHQAMFKVYISASMVLKLKTGHICPMCAQVGSLRMVLSLEELGPATQQTPHQGPVDTATAAAAAAAQPTASLGAAAQPSALPAQTSSAAGQQAAANPVSSAQQAWGSTMSGSQTVCLVACSWQLFAISQQCGTCAVPCLYLCSQCMWTKDSIGL